MSEKSVTLNIRVNEELRKEFKSCTAKNGQTMSEVIVDMIKDYIEECND